MIRWLLDTDHTSLQERGHPILLEHPTSVPPDEMAVSAASIRTRPSFYMLLRHAFGHRGAAVANVFIAIYLTDYAILNKGY